MNKVFKAFSQFIANRPKTVLVLVLAVTVVFGFGFRGLAVDSDMTDDIPSTVPEKAFYDEVGKIFPSNDFIIVALSNSGGVFTTGMLTQVREWTDALAAVDGVKGVISLSSAGIIRGTESGIVIEDAMGKVPETAEEMAAYRKRIETSDMTASLVGKDGKSTSILVTIKEGVDSEPLPRVRISLPAGTVAGDDFLAELAAVQAVPAGADAPVAAVKRVYLPSSEADRAEALAKYGEEIGADKKGMTTVLAVFERGVTLDTTGAEIKTIAAKRGWKSKPTAAAVTSYERIMGAIAGLSSHTDGKVYVSGSKAVSSIVGKLLITDLALLFPVVIAVIALILFLSFRTVRGVLMPLGNVVVSVIWAMGLMGLLGQAITMATMILPIILIAVGTAYTIHVINRFYEDLVSIPDKKEAIASTVSHVALPVFLAGATTVIGFSSLAASSIPAMRMFGILSALGILFALILSLTLTPALLAVLPKPKPRTVQTHDDSKLANILAGLGRFVARRPGLTVAVSLAFIVGIGIFAPRVSFETNTLNSFKANSEIRKASEYLNDNFSGITVMTVVVRTDEEGAILEPAVLRAMDVLQGRLETLRLSGDKVVAPGEKGYESAKPIVGGSQSIVTFVKGINKALNADNPAFNKVPDDVTPVPVSTETYAYRNGLLTEYDSETQEVLATYKPGDGLRVEGGLGFIEVASTERKVDLATGTAVDLIPGRVYAGQLVFQYENSGDPENIEAFIDNPRRTARVNVFIKSASSSIVGQVQAKARASIAELFPAGSKADITGLSNLTLAILRLLVQSQIGSVLSSLVICFLFISLISRNLIEGLFSIIPLTGALIINFGTMAIFGIPIDISTATIASIGIGIGIDYTLHFLERLKLSLCSHDLPGAIEETMRTTGKGIFVNALAVAGGFAALLASQLRGNIFMGVLMAMIMLTSSTFAVTLLPALLRIFNPGFLYKKALKKESL
jgi:uncharacterized protein